MASYSNTNYTNDYFDTTGYFNPTSQTSSNIDIDELDTRYLQKSGGTISNNLLVNGSVDIQTSLTIPNIGNVENAIEGKQATITTATNLTSKSLTTDDIVLGSVNIDAKNYFDTLVVRRPTGHTGETGNYTMDFREIQVWVNGNNILKNNSGSLTSYFADFSGDRSVPLSIGEDITKIYNNLLENPSAISSNNSSSTALIIKDIPLNAINDIQAIVYYAYNSVNRRVSGVAIELYNSTKDPNLTLPLAYTTEISSLFVYAFRFDFPSINTYTDFVNFESGTAITTSGSTTRATIPVSNNVNINGGLLVEGVNIITELGTKQPTINDGDLSISNTSGLQTALNDKQNTINDGDLTIANTAELQTALDDKQDEITTDTNLTLNSITTSSLNTSGRVGFDTTNIQFNTLVLRRPIGNDKIVLNEIQVWVNDVNILPPNSGDLNGYFAEWDTDKDTPIPALDFGGVKSVDKVYNNILEINSGFGTHSNGGNALIIKDIPLTNINDIQSIVYYNRFGEDRAIGLVLEIYNTTNDADLIYPLASSNVITTESLRYRFDFPSITSYSGFADENSLRPGIKYYLNFA